uniref:Uncharacterized protein n=1 Tax=Anguilla anguilla TaxID=7936 RepID=A0A0E9PHA4_ANGAN
MSVRHNVYLFRNVQSYRKKTITLSEFNYLKNTEAIASA